MRNGHLQQVNQIITDTYWIKHTRKSLFLVITKRGMKKVGKTGWIKERKRERTGRVIGEQEKLRQTRCKESKTMNQSLMPTWAARNCCCCQFATCGAICWTWPPIIRLPGCCGTTPKPKGGMPIPRPQTAPAFLTPAPAAGIWPGLVTKNQLWNMLILNKKS